MLERGRGEALRTVGREEREGLDVDGVIRGVWWRDGLVPAWRGLEGLWSAGEGEEGVGLEAADDAADYFGGSGWVILPEDNPREEPRD